jgi:endoglucanase
LRRALAALLACVLLVAGGCGGGEAPPAAVDPRAAADAFLDHYLDPDGRVVRHDEGGDTVSEGQAYALLVSALTGDEARFDRTWRWTRAHLQRDDGLLAWHWQDGRVVDPHPAADADLDAARALALAARRFARPALRRQARRMAAAVLSLETRNGRLVAGPWARERGVLNPSYVSPAAATTLARLGHAPAWHQVRDQGLATARALTEGPQLPPDWAVVASGSQSETTATTARVGAAVRATGPPADPGATPAYGYDAVRLPIRLAEACDPRARRLAAALWPLLRRGDPAILPRTRDSHGAPGATRSPVALVAAAAAADAANDARARDRLLAAAQALDAEKPTYYGSAWIALGSSLLSRSC